MLYREKIPVYEIHTKQHIVWVECEILSVDITWCNHWGLVNEIRILLCNYGW